MQHHFNDLSIQEKREAIISAIDDLISDFLYYDRKEDSIIGVGDIEDAIRDGVISVKEIIEEFSERLEHNLV